MTDREKLIKLLSAPCRKHTHCSEDYCQRNREHCKSDFADHLLANGVRLETKQAISDKISDKIETNIYDSEEIHHNCTVQILRNSITGEQSIGWWAEELPPMEF